jgi:hypothetical protein
MEVLQWARQQGCPWNRDLCLGLARALKRDTAIEWMLSVSMYQGGS